MRKKHLITTSLVMAAIMALGATALTGCGKPLTDEPLNAVKIADYTKTAEDRKETFASGSKGYSWENGAPFNVWWKPQNVSYDGGKMSLSISEMTVKEQKWDEDKQENVDVEADYYGAEERSEHYYGYGDFQVRMKPAKIAGTASTFFTCTGPYDKWYSEDGTEVIKENQHDEIDIEFLGKNTNKVQFNYFVNGKGGHEYMYNLGFDASEEFHDYGYRWTESYITWFVDNKPVYRVDRKGDEPWPSHPGRIIMNYWCGTQSAESWMGKFADDYSGKAEYEYVATSATQCPDPNTAHIKEDPNPPVVTDIPAEGWTDIVYSDFGGWSGYTIDKTDGITISHSEAMSDWACEGMDLADSYSWIKFKLKNNSDVAADLRIDVKDKTAGGAVEAVYPASENVKVLTADAAAFVHIDANAELEVAIKIKNMSVNQLVVFLNSTMGTDNASTGNITISELKGIVNNDVETPEPPKPDEDGTMPIAINAFDGWGMYTVDKTEGLTISHDADKKGTYNCCGMDLSSDYGVIKFTIKNNSDTNGAVIKIDVKKKGEAEGDNGTGGVATVTATGSDTNNYVYANDYDDSAVIVIAAGGELEITITVKSNVVVNQFVVFLNSTGDATATAGSITITALRGSAKSTEE